MITHDSSTPPDSRHLSAKAPRRLGPALLIAVSLCTAVSLCAQDADDANRRRRGGNGGQDEQQGRRNFNPEDMQARIANAMRERLEITDDEEWKLISERIAKITELRRASGAGPAGLGAMAFGGRGGPGGPGGGNADQRGGGRGARGGNPNSELGSLQAAVRDKLPEAEIKARLARLREARKNDEAKLVKAQEELRAVLTVRQEAVAVVFGLLP